MLQMHGTSGELRRAYLSVARLGRWELDGTGALSAEVLEGNDYWLQAGADLTLRLQCGARAWVWRAATVTEVGGGRVLVRAAGSPEVQDA